MKVDNSFLAQTATAKKTSNIAPVAKREEIIYVPCILLSSLIATYRRSETLIERITSGAMFATTLLAREYAPNSSGPNPFARKRVTNIREMVTAKEVTVVETISLKKGLNFILEKILTWNPLPSDTFSYYIKVLIFPIITLRRGISEPFTSASILDCPSVISLLIGR